MSSRDVGDPAERTVSSKVKDLRSRPDVLGLIVGTAAAAAGLVGALHLRRRQRRG